jgi:hypothetical protein
MGQVSDSHALSKLTLRSFRAAYHIVSHFALLQVDHVAKSCKSANLEQVITIGKNSGGQ